MNYFCIGEDKTLKNADSIIDDRIDDQTVYHAGDTEVIETYFGTAILTNSRQDFRLTIALPKPIGSDVSSVTITCNVTRAWVNGDPIVSSSTAVPSPEVNKFGAGGLALYLRKSSAWTSTSAYNNCVAGIQLSSINITFNA